VVDQRPPFGEVYEAFFPFVWRSARRLGAPQGTLDDVVQEIFVVVHRRLGDFEARSSMKTWIFGIVLNVVRTHRRKLRTSAPHALRQEGTADPEGLSDTAAGPHELASKAEAARLVDRLLDSMEDTRREVFVLAELEQMTVPDIAAALDIPLNTAYSRLRLAREEFAAAAARHRARDEWRVR
jgi:RNA polymerase sigma-70 factor (ECF subfamily)